MLLYFFCSSWEEFPPSADTVFTSFYLHVTTSERLRGWDDSRRGHPAATTAQVSGPCVFSAEEQRGWLTLSRDADVILISLGSNSLNFPSPSSPPQLNITFPLKLPRSNRSHSSLFPSPLKLQRVMHFTASLQHFPNCTRWPDTHTHTQYCWMPVWVELSEREGHKQIKMSPGWSGEHAVTKQVKIQIQLGEGCSRRWIHVAFIGEYSQINLNSLYLESPLKSRLHQSTIQEGSSFKHQYL